MGRLRILDYARPAVAQGIKDCNVQTDVPAIFCVLTDDNKEQSIARSGGCLGNKRRRGWGGRQRCWIY